MRSLPLFATLMALIAILGTSSLFMTNQPVFVQANTTMSNSTNTTTTMMGNTTTMMDNTTTTMMENTTTTTMMMDNTTTSTLAVTTSTAAAGNITTVWIQCNIDPTSQNFNPLTFINELANALSVSNMTLNLTSADANAAFVAITSVNAMTVATAATQLSMPTLSGMGIITIVIVETSTPAPPTTTGNATSTSTTAAVMTTTSTTAEPVMTTTTTAAPAPSWPCSSLVYHDTCFMNSTCMHYNKTCIVECSAAGSNANLCNSWSHCMSVSNGKSSQCIPKCSTIMMQDACLGSDLCTWYNGKCDVFCALHVTSNTCAADEKCWFDTNASVCRPNCALGTDPIQCSYFLTNPGELACSWNTWSKSCQRMCYSYSATECAMQPGCFYSSALQSCGPACSGLPSDACGASAYCMWEKGNCSLRCAFRTEGWCNMSAACMMFQSPQMSMCYLANCSAIMDAHTCMKESSSCQWDNARSMCYSACQMARGQENCLPAPYCNATGMSCDKLACSYASVEGDCNAKDGCTWVNQMCKPVCKDLDAMTCAMYDHCVAWGNICGPKCNLYTGSSSCMHGGEECAWSTSTNKCYTKCSTYNNNKNSCTAPNSGCVFRNTTMVKACTASCSMATSQTDCMSPFYQDLHGCFWDAQASMCKVACEFAAVTGGCEVPCSTQNAFNWCGMAPPQTTSTSGMAASTTGASASSTTMAAGNQSSTTAASGAAGQSTTAGGSMNQGNSTTAGGNSGSISTTMAPTTMTPPTTTQAPAGTPRLQFTISSTANATGNITAAAFAAKLAGILGIPASAITATVTSNGVVQVSFTSGSNATNEATAALNLNQNALTNLGAMASPSSLAPATTTAAPEEEGPNMGLIIGCAVGGAVLLIIILVIIKKSSSGGSGSQYLDDDRRNGDQPMLQVPEQNRNNML